MIESTNSVRIASAVSGVMSFGLETANSLTPSTRLMNPMAMVIGGTTGCNADAFVEVFDEFHDLAALLDHQGIEFRAKFGIARTQHPRFGPNHEAFVVAIQLSVDVSSTKLDMIERQIVILQGKKFGVGLLMIAAQKLDEQIALAVEIRIKRAARIARRGGDVFDAGVAETLLCDQSQRGIEQTLLGLIAAVFARQALSIHPPIIARRRAVKYKLVFGYRYVLGCKHGC